APIWTRNRAVVTGAVRSALVLSEGYQVGEQPIGARHPLGELPEEGQARVYVVAAAVWCNEQRAPQRSLAGIAHREQRRPRIVPRIGEVQAALVHPSLEVALRDPVRPRERGVLRL